MIYGILIISIIITPILIAYYYDYKSNPSEFSYSLKSLGKGALKGLYKGLFYAIIFVSLNAIYEYFIPLNKEHGIEFNSERKKNRNTSY